MILYEIFSHSDRFHYRAPLISWATCFLILCTALTFLPPFLWTYFAGGFWIKESRFVEQARVDSALKYFINVENSVPTNIRSFSSSYVALNQAFQNQFIPGMGFSVAEDFNKDGVTDRLVTTIELLFDTSLSITNINVWLIFQYGLRARQQIVMETMALIQLPSTGSSVPVSQCPFVTIIGDLIFKQRLPIQSSGLDTGYNQSIINLNTIDSVSFDNFTTVLNSYFSRNYFTSFQSSSIAWSSGCGSASVSNILTVNVTMNIPTQSIRFIPGFWQEFKWGWIQYLAVLLPFIVVFNRVKEVVFGQQLIRTLVERPLHRVQM